MEGIGKLIELLNEWERERVNHNTKEYIKRGKNSFTRLGIIEVISKSYGFIKWLVDNDKIDVNKVKKEFYNNICITEYGDEDRVMGDDNLVIAVLSISDSPIKFLCSILK